MAEKEKQSPNQIASANGNARNSDTEAAAAGELPKKKLTKRLLNITKCVLSFDVVVILPTAVIKQLASTVMEIRTPEFQVREVTLANFNGGTPWLSATMNAEFSVKNTNFGLYKYCNTTVVFSYKGTQVGQVSVPNSRANWRSTKKFNVALNLSLGNISDDLSGGTVQITSQAKMWGRVELMLVMKKNISTDMDCSMDIATATQQITNIVCN